MLEWLLLLPSVCEDFGDEVGERGTAAKATQSPLEIRGSDAEDLRPFFQRTRTPVVPRGLVRWEEAARKHSP